jgi:hypothetical protein
MSTDNKHTEGKLSFIEAGMNQYVLQANGVDIFKSFAMVPSSQQLPNATRIVEAWNNWDEVVKALRLASVALIAKKLGENSPKVSDLVFETLSKLSY